MNMGRYSAPRRMFLGEVPLLFGKREGSDSNTKTKNEVGSSCDEMVHFVRLMGTVIEILPCSSSSEEQTSSSSPESISGLERCPQKSSLKRKRQDEEHPIPSSGQSSGQSSGGDCEEFSFFSFVIDDGTGTIIVLSKRRTQSRDNLETSHSSVQSQQKPQPSRPTVANLPSSSTAASTIQSIISSPPPPIMLGHTVECIGKLHTVNRKNESDCDKSETNTNHQPSTQQVWLEATAVSIVHNPQEETLRWMELSSPVSSQDCSDDSDESETIQNGETGALPLTNNSNLTTNSTTGLYTGKKQWDDDHRIPKNRILVAGNLAQKLNALYFQNKQIEMGPQTSFHSAGPNNPKHGTYLNGYQIPNSISCRMPNPLEIQTATMNFDQAFRFIRYSRDHGGISVKDLESLVGASKANAKNAVRVTMEEMQNQGMVYVKEGKYFPM